MGIEVYLSEEKIQERITELAGQIDRDYEGKGLVVIGVLNGAFMFVSDLIRKVNVPVSLDFIKASSYGDSTESSGELKMILDTSIDISGKDVLIVEDIVDTGLTMRELLSMLGKRNPASLKVASLLYKPSRKLFDVKIDYLGFEIEDHFVIGYGLDFAGRYRELPYIGLYSDDS